MSASSQRPTIAGQPDAEAFDLIAQLIDQATDETDLDLAKYTLQLADELDARELSASDKAILDYFRANAWACLYQKRMDDRAAVWDFEQPEVGQQIFLLRRAMNSPGFVTLHPLRRCQILTNLANQLDTVGRFVEARTHWTAALKIEPGFWMALANRGRALMHYAAALYDPAHEAVFAVHAYDDLLAAVRQSAEFRQLGDPGIISIFSKSAEQIARHYDIENARGSYKSDGWDMGDEAQEQTYRQWCLANTLFLNPLNDVDASSIAARDVMGLPSFMTKINEPPIVVGMFNELKQAFVSARWLLWEGVQEGDPHFSDREVLLINTLDYPAYGVAVEKVKLAYRAAYSILDKISYFLNYYLGLGVPERLVSFRSIWREKKDGSVREQFTASENWPFRGLFWLSKDLFEGELMDSTEPDARALADLRNHLEHKYVRVVQDGFPVSDSGPFHDTLAYRITRSDLERKTLRLLQLTRAALVYLLLGMHREEKRRRAGQEGLMGTMSLDTWSDEWKR